MQYDGIVPASVCAVLLKPADFAQPLVVCSLYEGIIKERLPSGRYVVEFNDGFVDRSIPREWLRRALRWGAAHPVRSLCRSPVTAGWCPLSHARAAIAARLSCSEFTPTDYVPVAYSDPTGARTCTKRGASLLSTVTASLTRPRRQAPSAS